VPTKKGSTPVVKFERSMTIDQPLETVFDYIADPLHFVPIWPGLVEIKQVQPQPTGGYRFDYVYYLAGMRFEGIGEFVEFVPKTRIVCKLTGGIEGTLTFTFEPAVLATTVFLTIAYTVPTALLTKLPEVAFTELSVHEIDCLLANLKTMIPFFAPAPALR
jgi:carbon monoxide dehydrogenase subunit G